MVGRGTGSVELDGGVEWAMGWGRERIVNWWRKS